VNIQDNFAINRRDLFPRLSAVVGFAQHPAIFGFGFPAQVPRIDVVGFHFVYLEMLLADGTDAFLPFVGFAILAVSETAEVQM